MVDYDTLNEAQYEAVMCTEGPLLVLAGAGSGKTRVLTYRIAHLLQDCGVAPWQILAITFTNKAAREMRDRLGALVGPAARGMWVSTFHSMCVRILRANADILGFTKNFTIYADDDSKRLIKDIMANLQIDPKRFPDKAVRGRISDAKNRLIVPEAFASEARNPVDKVVARVYPEYQNRLRAANAFDFDDLLMYTYLLFKHHPEVLEAYQDRFRYLLVDGTRTRTTRSTRSRDCSPRRTATSWSWATTTSPSIPGVVPTSAISSSSRPTTPRLTW